MLIPSNQPCFALKQAKSGYFSYFHHVSSSDSGFVVSWIGYWVILGSFIRL